MSTTNTNETAKDTTKAADTPSPAAKATKPATLTAGKVIRNVQGCPVAVADRIAKKCTKDECSAIVTAYAGGNVRAVVQKAMDRIADEAIAKEAKKETS